MRLGNLTKTVCKHSVCAFLPLPECENMARGTILENESRVSSDNKSSSVMVFDFLVLQLW
jgi:hypothetical protein